jgi:hypothetical protein
MMRAAITSLVLLVCLWASPALAAWAHIQTNGSLEAGSDANIAHAITSSLTAGSLVVCHIAWVTAGGSISTVADGTNSYAASGSAVSHADGFSVHTYYAMNVSAGSVTVTVTFSGATTNKALICQEYSGIATSGALDVTKTNSQAGSTATDGITSGSTTSTAENNELVVAAGWVRSGASGLVSGTGFNTRAPLLEDAFYGFRAEDKNLATAGDAVSTFTASDAPSGAMVKVSTFKEPSAGGACRGALTLLGVGGC